MCVCMCGARTHACIPYVYACQDSVRYICINQGEQLNEPVSTYTFISDHLLFLCSYLVASMAATWQPELLHVHTVMSDRGIHLCEAA